jgi:rhamnose transport system substrate-binding protein
MKSILKSAALGLLATSAIVGAAFSQDTVRVAFVPQIQGIPYYVAMEEGANRAAEAFGVEYIQQGPTSTNAADQLRIFESFVSQGVDVVGVSPVDVETLKPAIASARAQGIHVITSDADAAGSEREFYVAQAMDQDLGFTILDEMVSRTGPDAKIAIISDAPTIASLNAWIAAIQERAETEYPDLEIVSVDHTDGTASRLPVRDRRDDAQSRPRRHHRHRVHDLPRHRPGRRGCRPPGPDRHRGLLLAEHGQGLCAQRCDDLFGAVEPG